MACLRAYFDESNTHGSAKTTRVAGLIGPSANWEILEEKWKALLARIREETGKNIGEFHATDCASGRGEWFGIDGAIRDAYLFGFTNLLASDPGFHQIAISVSIDSWNAIATKEFGERFNSPYQFCAEGCFRQASSVSRKYFEKTEIAAVFAIHKQYTSLLDEALSPYVDSNKNVNVKSLSYASPAACPRLQSADLVAYEDSRFWE